MSEIVIIGAGPIGLWTAIQLKKRNPKLFITIYEKHHQYQRSHVLRLDYWSLILYAKQIKTAREEQFYQEILAHRLSKLLSQPAKSIYIRTNELESSLKSFALDLGVNIIQQNIQHPDEVVGIHPHCSTFIAADGAKSSMRTGLLGQHSLEEYPLQYIVEIKYQVSGKAENMNPLIEQFKTNKTMTHMAFEYIGKEKNDVTPITLRFFLDKETYEKLPEASFKNPLTFESNNLPESLKKDINTYMNIREQKGNELYLNGSSKISKLVLSLYCSNEFAIKRNDKSWFLVGDCAMGVPYFRALNSGLILSSRLSQILTGKILGISNNVNRKIFLYNVHKPMHIATEFAIARAKNLGLQGYDWFRKMTTTLFPPEWNFDVEEKHKAIYSEATIFSDANNETEDKIMLSTPSDIKVKL